MNWEEWKKETQKPKQTNKQKSWEPTKRVGGVESPGVSGVMIPFADYLLVLSPPLPRKSELGCQPLYQITLSIIRRRSTSNRSLETVRNSQLGWGPRNANEEEPPHISWYRKGTVPHTRQRRKKTTWKVCAICTLVADTDSRGRMIGENSTETDDGHRRQLGSTQMIKVMLKISLIHYVYYYCVGFRFNFYFFHSDFGFVIIW